MLLLHQFIIILIFIGAFKCYLNCYINQISLFKKYGIIFVHLKKCSLLQLKDGVIKLGFPYFSPFFL